MDYGWIKLHRKITQKAYYQKSQYIHLWIHLLLEANHKPKEFMWNGKIILIKEGQLLTGRDALSEKTGIPHATVDRILNMLESEQQITQEKTTKFRIITIINYTDFQGEQQMSNKRATNEQQTSTNKNDKNEEKKDICTSVLNQWNSFAKENNLPTILKLSETRKSGIANRFKEKEFNLEAIFQKIKQSKFLLGSTGWKVDFDFVFCSANNYLKILEGKYNGDYKTDTKQNEPPKEWKMR